MLRAVAKSTPGWTDQQRTVVAGLLDALCSLTSYERLVEAWKLDGDDDAADAIGWLIGKVIEATIDDRPPPSPPRR